MPGIVRAGRNLAEYNFIASDKHLYAEYAPTAQSCRNFSGNLFGCFNAFRSLLGVATIPGNRRRPDGARWV